MMTIGSILLGLALLVIVALFLARPLFTTTRQSTAYASDRRRQLEKSKEAYLNEIRALDFDHETGKVPTEVYEQQRAQLVVEAAAVLEELEGLPAAEEDVYSQIEAAIAAKRHRHVLSGKGQQGFCSQCGQPVDSGDKFCAHCGQAIKVVSPAT
jgi:hypothetical protein